MPVQTPAIAPGQFTITKFRIIWIKEGIGPAQHVGDWLAVDHLPISVKFHRDHQVHIIESVLQNGAGHVDLMDALHDDL